MFEKIIVILV